MTQAPHTPCLVPAIEVITDLAKARTQNTTDARAYQIWEKNGHEFGQSERDWYQAVRELENSAPWIIDTGILQLPHDDGVSPHPSQATRDAFLRQAAE